MLSALNPRQMLGAVELERARMLYIIGCLINAGVVAALALFLLSV
jgi:hypothetical protein